MPGFNPEKETRPEIEGRSLRADGWPDGIIEDDRKCWICGAPTRYQHCKIICIECGFMRDCSDPYVFGGHFILSCETLIVFTDRRIQ